MENDLELTPVEKSWRSPLEAHRPEGCLSGEQLLALIEQGRKADGYQGLMDHVSVCPVCQTALLEAKQVEAMRPAYAEASRQRRRLVSWVLVPVAAAILVALIPALFRIEPREVAQSKPPPRVSEEALPERPGESPREPREQIEVGSRESAPPHSAAPRREVRVRGRADQSETAVVPPTPGNRVEPPAGDNGVPALGSSQLQEYASGAAWRDPGGVRSGETFDRGPLIEPDPRNRSLASLRPTFRMAAPSHSYLLSLYRFSTDGKILLEELRGRPPLQPSRALVAAAFYEVVVSVEGDPLSRRKYLFRTLTPEELDLYREVVQILATESVVQGKITTLELESLANALYRMERYGDALDLLRRHPHLFSESHGDKVRILENTIARLHERGL